MGRTEAIAEGNFFGGLNAEEANLAATVREKLSPVPPMSEEKRRANWCRFLEKAVKDAGVDMSEMEGEEGRPWIGLVHWQTKPR